MNRKTIVLTVLVALTLWPVLAVLAQSGGSYDLMRSTIAGGGGVSSGGVYLLGGTVGQPDAAARTGGVYTLVGGFWGGGVSGAMSRYVYLPIVLR